ncbi:type II secretion system protein [Paenarthrobacter sp. C1]|uniref:type II secretion system protein n=1 Tax=Paenarthrobacter sp. C1 TaxID=3400220 RepID=UPI003BF55CBC
MTPPELTHALVRSDASREGRARRSDGGFVILDVLLGILVLAILLLTVIMSVGPYRQRSYQASAISDARQLGGRIEATLSDNATLVGADCPPVKTH